jgi:hypothetical protein
VERGGSPREAERQCLVREENEVVELRNVARASGAARARLRCECGDPACDAAVALTHSQYEGVRACGSHFLVGLNHENPESAWVLREGDGFAVIDVVAADARYVVLARNPRHAWVDECDRSSQ